MTILEVLIPGPGGGSLGGAAGHMATLSHAATTGGHLGFWAGAAIGAGLLAAAFGAKTVGQHVIRRRNGKQMPIGFDFDPICQRADELEAMAYAEDRRFAVPYLANAAATIEAIRARPGRRNERGLEW